MRYSLWVQIVWRHPTCLDSLENIVLSDWAEIVYPRITLMSFLLYPCLLSPWWVLGHIHQRVCIEPLLQEMFSNISNSKASNFTPLQLFYFHKNCIVLYFQQKLAVSSQTDHTTSEIFKYITILRFLSSLGTLWFLFSYILFGFHKLLQV